MILTCPNCATRFFADDQAIGLVGRRVKCDVCGAVWTGLAPPPPHSRRESEARMAADAASAPPSAAPVEPSVGERATSPLFVNRGTPRRDGRARGVGSRWALGALILILVIMAAVFVFRPAIERTFPGTVSVYQSLGLRSPAASRA